MRPAMEAIEMKRDNYVLKMLLLIGVLFAIMVWMFNKIQQKDPIPQHVIMPVSTNKTIHILKSYATAVTYQKNGYDKTKYTEKLNQFDKYIKALGYKTDYVEEEKVSKLSSDDILFVPDAIALSSDAKLQILNFVRGGGNLFFNNACGFSDKKGNYIGDDFVRQITNLSLSKSQNFVNFKKGAFVTQRLLSPLTNDNSGKLLDISTYDPIPIFVSPKTNQPDFLLTTYAQTNPPLAMKDKDDFTLDEAGVAWHGYLGAGKWYYMNLPSYFFYDVSPKVKTEYNKIFNAVVNYLDDDEVIQKFPYVDRQNIVFISEDTEYKFKNFKKYSDLAQKYKMPVTAFIVSSLAVKKEHQDMMKEIARNPYVEFGSHSHMHKKIIETNATYVKQETANTKILLDKYSSEPIIGFRPPREELDEMMKKYLEGGGFKYVLSSTKQYLYPKFDKKYTNLLNIPRHGTDDYNYLINLDWNQKQIVDQMKKETQLVTALNGIYTLSIHTHLFSYSTNINIVEEYFKYIKQHPEFTPLQGRDIAKRIKQNDNIDISYSKSANIITLVVDNKNDTDVENFTCKMYKNPNLKIRSIKCNETPGSKNTKVKDAVNIKLKHLKAKSKTTVYIEIG
jgi:peptidoglycan/xylan/chitin deacetylase (PgdA/CDA1 family)